MTKPTQLDIDAIRFGGGFMRMNKAAEFAVLIDDCTTKLIAAQKKRADLLVAEDAALFGQGDLAKVQADLKQCDEEIATLQKTIDGASTRRTEAAKVEATTEMEEMAKDARAKGNLLRENWRKVYGHIEEIRGLLFECDQLKRSVQSANDTFGSAKRQDLTVNLTTIRREAMTGPRKVIPDRLTRPAVQVDKVLTSFLTLGGILDSGRATMRGVLGAVSSKADYHHPAERGD